jgi:Helicase associated domain
MSIHHDLTQSLPWDSILRRRSEMSARRDSVGSRRNSLLSASLFDFPLTPGNREHALFSFADPDPFAPLSFSEPLPLSPSISRQQTIFDRLLGDRSESSVVSVPTIVSMGSYSTPHHQFRYGNPTAMLPSAVHQILNHNSIDHYLLRNQAMMPNEVPSSSSSFPKTKSANGSTTIPLSSPSSSSVSFKPANIKTRSKEVKHDEGDEEDDDDDDDDTAQNRFKPFHEEKWSLRYRELLEFHRMHGHAAVPHTYPPNPQLARWVKRQRRQYKLRKDNRQSTMTTERLDLLSDVGFVWDSHDVNWREKLYTLESYRKEFGNCNVPSNFRDKKLATWVKCQRRQYKLYWDGKPSAMGPDRILELEKIGFEWEIRSAFPRSNGRDDVSVKPEEEVDTYNEYYKRSTDI